MKGSHGSRRADVAGAILVTLFACMFAWCIGLRTDGAWYSASWAHRLQTEAFFRGTFALQSVPNGQMADWVWANGSQQVWGLGAAFLRFPLELIARWSGSIGFPDRVTLLLAFIGVAAVLSRAFRDLAVWQRACLLLFTAFAPPFVTLCRTRLSVYEEASACACLVGLLLAGMLLQLARWPSRCTLWWLGAIAGIAPFFRPTLLFTAAVTLAMALAIDWRQRRRATDLFVATALFGFGLLAIATTNFVRFGSPFETGQLLNVSYIPVDQFSKVFGYPFWYEPWPSAVAELVSSLSLVDRFNGVDWYQAGIHPWQSDTLRFREFYFTTFTPLVLAVLALSWVAVAFANMSGRQTEDPRIAAAAIWSVAVFAILFLFYLWAPSMTSRYAVDFVPAVAMGLVAFLMLMFRTAATMRSPAWSTLVALIGIAWVSHDIARAEISPTHSTRLLVTADVVRERLPRPAVEGTQLPDGYRCGQNPERFGVKFNGSGWAHTSDCTVDAGTMFFFDDIDCFRVHVAPSKIGGTLVAEQLAWVRAMIGLTSLESVRTELVGDGAQVTFCAPAGRTTIGSGVEVVYLGWMDPKLVRRGSRPLRLLDIEKVAR